MNRREAKVSGIGGKIDASTFADYNVVSCRYIVFAQEKCWPGSAQNLVAIMQEVRSLREEFDQFAVKNNVHETGLSCLNSRTGYVYTIYD